MYPDLDSRPIQQSTQPIRVIAGLVVAVGLVVGIFVLGRLAPTETVAMAATTAWFAIVAVAAFVVWRLRRELLVPLVTGYLVVALPAGVWLGLPQVTDRTVSERVVVGVRADQARPGDAVLAQEGRFESQAHPTSGSASLVRLADGRVRLTLTGFQTDNGPDLRVYLVPAGADPVDGAVDLGALRGNRGDQQYAVPDGIDPADYDRVVIWCRAFAVAFGTATLTAA